MRNIIGLVLAGLGVFLLATGILVRFYAVPRLIAAPTDVYNVTTLQAADASYFDVGSVLSRTGATVTATFTVRGDVKASHGDTAVWDSFTALEDVENKNTMEAKPARFAFNRRTAGLTNTVVGTGTTTPQSGLGPFWPTNTTKRTYQLFDIETKRAWPTSYDGQESINGVQAYRFVSHIPATKLDEVVANVPGDWLGLGSKSGDVAVDRYYQADITYWIDPRSGTTLNKRVQVHSTLRAKQGTGELLVADMDLRMTGASQRALLNKADDAARSIQALKIIAPLTLLFLGLLAITGGVVLSTRTRRGARHRQEEAMAETTPAKIE